ncbi:MAG TPA: hypothetical protein VIL58_09005, partial [Thermoplasmata archaeon]
MRLRVTDDPREHRASRPAAGVLAGLFLLVLAANLLWPETPSTGSGLRMDPDESPFPLLRMGPELRVVALAPSANLSTRLLLTSLQGLANRAQVELYLDTSAVSGNTTDMLSFLSTRYDVNYSFLTTAEAIETYAPRTAGLVVYDPSRPESVNVATMIAADRGAALVGPDLAPSLEEAYGLPVLFDYRTSD